jgi:FtsZ-binding cell division protein ZapB
MLQGYGDVVLRTEALEKEVAKAKKHSSMLLSKLDGAFAQYHNEVHDMQAKSDELVRKNKSLRNKNKGMPLACRVLMRVPCSSLTSPPLLFAELETRVEQLKASQTDMKNLFYREKEAR